MNQTVISYSSLDTNDFIDLDTALAEEELCLLGSSSKQNNDYNISLRSIDAKETERWRRSLVTPLSKYSPTPRSNSKSPTESYAESVALFQNLANNDQVDLVGCDLKDFMNGCDMDDLLSRADGVWSPQQNYRHHATTSNKDKDTLTSTKLNNHNKIQQESTLLQKLSESHQQKEEKALHHPQHSYTYAVSHTHKPSLVNSSNKHSRAADTQIIGNNSTNTPAHLNQPEEEAVYMRKRRSIDSDGLKRMHTDSSQQPTVPSAQEKLKLKRHSMLSLGSSRNKSTLDPLPTRSKLSSGLKPIAVTNRTIPTLVASKQKSSVPANVTSLPRRTSASQQTDTRRWSNYMSAQKEEPTSESPPHYQATSAPQHTATYKTVTRNSLLQPTQRRPSYEPVVDDSNSPKTFSKRNSFDRSMYIQEPRHTSTSQQPDRRRWSSYLPPQKREHTSDLPSYSQQANDTHLATASKAVNRNSLLQPTQRRPSYELVVEDVSSSRFISKRNSFDRTPHAQDLSALRATSGTEKARRRHTVSLSDKKTVVNTAAEQPSRIDIDKRSPLYGYNYRSSDAIRTVQRADAPTGPKQKYHSLVNESTTQAKDSSTRLVREPLRYRSRTIASATQDTVSRVQQRVALATSKPEGISRYSRRSEPVVDEVIEEDKPAFRRHTLTAKEMRAYEQAVLNEQNVSSARRNNIKITAEHRYNTLPTPRRNRSLTIPSSQYFEEAYAEKPSLMPLPVRHRKHSNDSISRYASVPEDKGISFSPPRENRLSFVYPEVQVVASHSSGGLSNSTTSSSHSGDLYYDPPTPPIRATVTSKRRSMPVLNPSSIDEQVCKAEHRYNSYLARTQGSNTDTPKETFTPTRNAPTRDNSTENVTSSARKVLAMVQQRRNRQSVCR